MSIVDDDNNKPEAPFAGSKPYNLDSSQYFEEDGVVAKKDLDRNLLIAKTVEFEKAEAIGIQLANCSGLQNLQLAESAVNRINSIHYSPSCPAGWESTEAIRKSLENKHRTKMISMFKESPDAKPDDTDSEKFPLFALYCDKIEVLITNLMLYFETFEQLRHAIASEMTPNDMLSDSLFRDTLRLMLLKCIKFSYQYWQYYERKMRMHLSHVWSTKAVALCLLHFRNRTSKLLISNLLQTIFADGRLSQEAKTNIFKRFEILVAKEISSTDGTKKESVFNLSWDSGGTFSFHLEGKQYDKVMKQYETFVEVYFFEVS